MRPSTYGIAAVVVAVAQIILCFYGPMTFLAKPTLGVFPVHSVGIAQDEIPQVLAFVERELVRTDSFTLAARRVIVDRLLERDPAYDPDRLAPVDYADALTIARELGLDRYAMTVAFGSSGRYDLTVMIRDTREGETLRTGRFSSNRIDNLLAGTDAEGEPLLVAEALAFETRGVGLTDWLVLALMAFQLAVGVYALAGGRPRLLIEAVWVPALVLFVFAYIHALSANMDYVQRFMASGGAIRLARDTSIEQLYAAARFGPMLILGGAAYVMQRLSRRDNEDRRHRPVVPGKPTASPLAARWALPAVIASALMFGLSFPSFVSLRGLGWLSWFSLVPLLLVIRGSTTGRGIFYGVTFGTLQALVVNYWHGTFSLISLHVVAIGFVVQYLLFMVVFVPLVRRSGRWGFLLVPAAWVGFEYLRSIGVLGYPWGIIGAAPYNAVALIQIATVTGVWGLSFLVVLANACCAWSLEELTTSGLRRDLRLRRAAGPAGVLAALLAASLGAGQLMLMRFDAVTARAPADRYVTLVLVQQNTDPRKHDYAHHLGRLYALTDEALDSLDEPPDLVVWPEGGFPIDLRYAQRPEMRHSTWARLAREFLAFQADMGTWLVTGDQDHAFIVDGDGTERQVNYNSSMLLDPDNEVRTVYHKRQLVPFTEHFPLDRDRFPGLYETLQKFDVSNWEQGTELMVFEHERMRFFTPICFEDLFPNEVRLFVREGADVIVNISNDYWSLTPVEGVQHGLHAVFRAVENRRPLVRATVSGYTIAVDAAGRVAPGALEPYTEGHLVARVLLPEPSLTPYTRYGDWLPLLCLAVTGITACGLVLIAARRRLATHGRLRGPASRATDPPNHPGQAPGPPRG